MTEGKVLSFKSVSNTNMSLSQPKPNVAAAKSNGRKPLTADALLFQAENAILQRNEADCRKLVKFVGRGNCAPVERVLNSKFSDDEIKVALVEMGMARYALANPEIAEKSQLGRESLEFGRNIDFAVRFIESGIWKK